MKPKSYRILKLHEGMLIDRAECDSNYDIEFYKIIRPAPGYGCFYADKYGANYDDEVGGYYEDDANIIQEYCILTATDIKNNLRRLYGECYDYVVWEGAEENEESEAV